MTTRKWPLPVEFSEVKIISGAAGGSDREAVVNIQITGKSDTVEAVRLLVTAAPDLLSSLEDCLVVLETHYVAGEKLSDYYPFRIRRASAALAKAGRP
jgi:hypothetical protein